jgi:hypothetical protein
VTPEPARYRPLDQFGHVVAPARLLYVSVPKVACTSLKALAAELTGRPLDRRPEDAVLHPEVAGRGAVHVRRAHPAGRLAELDPARLATVLGDPGWLRFTVTRHPLARLYSAWEDKVLLGQLLDRLDPPPLVTVDDGCIDVRASFAAFVDDLAARPGHYLDESHFTPQVAIVRTDLVAYDHRIDLAGLDAFVAGPLRDHLGRAVALPHANPGLGLRWSDAYTPASLEAATAVYRDDLEAFGYAAPDAVAEAAVVLDRPTSVLVDRLRGTERAFDRLAAETRRRRGARYGLDQLRRALAARTRRTRP